MSVTQISVFVESRPGHLARTLEAFSDGSISIKGFSAADTGEYGVVRFVVDKPQEALALLADRGMAARASDVLCVRLEDTPGELLRVLELMAEKGINVVYCYSIAATYFVFSVKDINQAEAALKEAPIDLATQETIANLDLGPNW